MFFLVAHRAYYYSYYIFNKDNIRIELMIY